MEALLGVEKQTIRSFGAGPAECAGRRGTFKEGYKSRSDLEEALDKHLETGQVCSSTPRPLAEPGGGGSLRAFRRAAPVMIGLKCCIFGSGSVSSFLTQWP